MKKLLVFGLLLCSFSSVVFAGIRFEDVSYTDSGTALEGQLVYDDDINFKRPAVMIVHQWMGITEYEKMRAEQFARFGYVVFIADIYGKDVHPADAKEAATQAGIYRASRPLMRQRALAGLAQLKAAKFTDPDRIAAVGYCFGGGVVLELARTGVTLNGVVSFHGNLDTPSPQTSKFSSEILVLHGADDPYVPWEQVTEFRKEMQSTKAKWQLGAFGSAVHAFSMKSAGIDSSKGAAYNAVADADSLSFMYRFLTRVFYRGNDFLR